MTFRLDGRVRERRILAAVQPIFAHQLPWKLSCPRNGEGAAVASEVDAQKSAEINIDKSTAFFFEEMVSVAIRLREVSNYELSAQSFQSCIDHITELLLFLEELVSSDILDHPLAQAGVIDVMKYQEQGHQACIDANEAPTPSLPMGKGWGFDFLWSWIPDLSRTPVDDVKQCVSQLPPNRSPSPVVSAGFQVRSYGKLEAIGRILSQHPSSDTGFEVICRNFIRLEHTLEFFHSGTTKAGYVNGCMEGIINLMGGVSLPPPTPKKVAQTKWQDRTSWKLSNQLFHILVNGMCRGQNHEAKIQLAGFELDKCCNSSLTLNLFISSCPPSGSWQECRCTPTPRSLMNRRNSAMVSDVCGWIRRFNPSKAAALFHVKFDDSCLWHPLKPDDHSDYDGASPTVTLEDLIKGGYLRETDDHSTSFSMNDKAVLALSLARCLLHLWESSWLTEPWQAKSIQFVSHPDRILDIHRPYITCSVKKRQPGESSLLFPDKFQPTLLAFARLLLEIETGTTILAETAFPSEEEVEAAIDLVLKQREHRFGRRDYNNAVAGYRHVKALLRRQEWDQTGNGDDHIHRMRMALYEAIVQHLEGNFNQIQDHERAMNLRTLYLVQHEASYTHLYPRGGERKFRRDPSAEPSHFSTDHLSRSTAAETENTLRLSSPEIILDRDHKAPQFFDDERGDGEYSIANTKRYLAWRSEYEKVYEKFVKNHLPEPPPDRVKIAILDTGFDRDHFAFEAREANIKAKHNCYNESQRNVPDRNGHGTFVASLILDYAPDAELYVIKITDEENARPEARIVVNAINHAVDHWDVDIISMSFGWPSSDFDGHDSLQAAIDKAYSKKVLMFAAAANSGGRLGRAYPASSSQVICVHSTDTYGTASKFSPTAEPNAINIATVGESIQSAWPTLLCHDKSNPNCVESRSGTSYATPIIAGIAAFLLQYARLHLGERVALALNRKEKMEALLRRCAERGPNYKPRDGYFYVELSLNVHNLFGDELEWVNHEIVKALKT